jgi:hypothetical protein
VDAEEKTKEVNLFLGESRKRRNRRNRKELKMGEKWRNGF